MLWDDILRVGANRTREDSGVTHFIGPVVYVDVNPDSTAEQMHYVIDGQQRIATLTLLLRAIEHLTERGHLSETELLPGFSSKEIRSQYLVNPLARGSRYFKLQLSQRDDALLRNIIGNDDPSADIATPSDVDSVSLWTSFDFFNNRLTKASKEGTLRALCSGLEGLRIIDVPLTEGIDNAQEIFESMNSTGLDLTKADLVRNFVLMNESPTEQNRLYKDHWQPLEDVFRGKPHSRKFDPFLKHYLTIKRGNIPTARRIYPDYKLLANEHLKTKRKDELMSDLTLYGEQYKAVAFCSSWDTPLNAALADLRVLNTEVVYPFLLKMYHAFVEGEIPSADATSVVRCVESYIFRRAVCGLASSGLNKVFGALTKNVAPPHFVANTVKDFRSVRDGFRFPSDGEFRTELNARDMYTFDYARYGLWKLENSKRSNGSINFDDIQVEHIMPQTLTVEWKKHLGSKCDEIHRMCKNSLGNLTIVSSHDNPGMGNKLFKDKVEYFVKGGYVLNGMLRGSDWGRQEIDNRTKDLAEDAVALWPPLESFC